MRTAMVTIGFLFFVGGCTWSLFDRVVDPARVAAIGAGMLALVATTGGRT